MIERSNTAVVVVDGPDPDNICLYVMARQIYRNVHLVLTGRPVNFDAKDVKDRSVNNEHTRIIHWVNAARFIEMGRNYGIMETIVYDGGVAPHTLVPHLVHFDEREFGDLPRNWIKVLEAGERNPLTDIGELADTLRKTKSFDILVGGPMTGVDLLLQEDPELQERVNVLVAMYASLGTADLIFGKQFNVACDAPSGARVLAMQFPKYLIPTECTKQDEVSFVTARELGSFLRATWGNRCLLDIYQEWYEAALEPRGERIVIHDACAVVATFDSSVYNFEAVEITEFPAGEDRDEWGTIHLRSADSKRSNLHIATAVNATSYMQVLRELLC